MDVAGYAARAWDLLTWFAETVVVTVGTSIFGGWNAVFGVAAAAFVLFLVTKAFSPRRDD